MDNATNEFDQLHPTQAQIKVIGVGGVVGTPSTK